MDTGPSKVAYIRLSGEDAEAAGLLEEEGGNSYHRSWHTSQLDEFLQRVYNYYYSKGFAMIVLHQVLSILTVAWVSALVIFVLFFIDYPELLATFRVGQAISFPSVFNPLFWAVLGCCTAIVVVQTVYLLWQVPKLTEIRHFYHTELRITEDELQTIAWQEVIKRLLKVKGLCIVKDKLTALDVTHRIMRRENYMIAIINKDVLGLRLPFGRSNHFVTKVIEWGVSYIVFGHIFEGEYWYFRDKSTLRDSVRASAQDPQARSKAVSELKLRMKMFGIGALILSPIIAGGLFVYFLLRYGEQLRSKPSSASTRKFTRYSRWLFREFNELPHELDDRLNRAIKPAKAFANFNPSMVISRIAEFATLVFGSVVLLLVVFGLIGDELLLDVEFLGRSLMWYLTICGSILLIARSLIKEKEDTCDPEQLMVEVAQHTHYLPKRWKLDLTSPKVRDEFLELFDYRLSEIVREIASIVIGPLMLLITLPQRAESLVLFMSEFTKELEGVGDVCVFADFDMRNHGNAKYGAPANVKQHQRTRHGKMEASFLHFQHRHPSWEPSESGNETLQNLDQYLMDNASLLVQQQVPQVTTQNGQHVEQQVRASAYSRMLASSLIERGGGFTASTSESSQSRRPSPLDARARLFRLDDSTLSLLQGSYYLNVDNREAGDPLEAL